MTKTEKRTVRTRKGPRQYTYLGCPLTRNRSAWCFRLCVPDAHGEGECGRLAPHGMKSRTQRAIEAHNRQQLKAHVEQLESDYLASPENGFYEPGVRITGGEAEIVIPIQERFLADGSPRLPSALCYKAMNDSAHLAVRSVVEDDFVSTVEFNIQLGQPVAAGELIARSMFVGMSDEQYLTESVLTDTDGREIGRATGIFKEARGQSEDPA